MLNSMMPFQSQYLNGDVPKKVKIFIETTANIPLGLQESVNKTPQNFNISFTPDNN